MDVSELKSKFLATETLYERIKAFRFERVQNIFGDNTPVPFEKGAKFVLHIIPVSSFFDNRQDIFKPDILPYKMGKEDEYNKKYLNYDGIVYHNGSNEYPADNYIQLFRNGTIEVVHNSFVNDKNKLINWKGFEYAYQKEFKMYLSLIEKLKILKPYIVFLSIVNVNGFILCPSNDVGRIRYSVHPIDRDILLVPDILLTDDNMDNLDFTLKPLFDPVWNACGYPQSQNYNDGRLL